MMSMQWKRPQDMVTTEKAERNKLLLKEEWGEWETEVAIPGWIDASTRTLDLHSKISGYSVPRTSSLWETIHLTGMVDGCLVVQTNMIPNQYHPVGLFPVPGHGHEVKPQPLVTFRFPLFPTCWSEPTPLTPGVIGWWFDNTAIWTPIEPRGDPVAFQITDEFCKWPDEKGMLKGCIPSPCLFDYRLGVSIMNIIRIALDGWPVIGPFLCPDGHLVQNKDLDECHGLLLTGNTLGLPNKVSFVLDGKVFRYSYVYVCNFEFPYTIGAFRSSPVSYEKQIAPIFV